MLHHQNADDINHKYAKSIIFYGGNPVMCNGAGGGGVAGGDICVGYTLIGPHYMDANGKASPASDPEFCDGPFKLGYVNGVPSMDNDGMIVKSTCFVTRAPVRRWKQGLSTENLVFQDGHLTFNSACKMGEFVDMLKGKYPSYTQAVKAMGKDIRRMAYHRHFCIGFGKLEQAELYYRGQIVGQGDDYKHIKLAPKFQFLQEVYEISRQAA